MLAQRFIPKTRTPRRAGRNALVILLAIAALTTLFGGTTAFTHAQGPEAPGDPIFAALLESGMIEPLGHARDVNGISITLDWVYACLLYTSDAADE